MPISRVSPSVHNTPGAAFALHVMTFAWGLGGLLLCAILWPDGDDLDGGKGPALLLLAVPLFAATVSFALGAILQRMAQWQAAKDEGQ